MELKYITKPRFMRRVAAWIIDFFCVVILFFGLSLFLDTPIKTALGISKINDEIAERAVEEGVASYQTVDGVETIVYIDANDERYVAFFSSEEIAPKQTKAMYLSVLGIATEVLISEFFMCFLVPLLLKNGQTFGKKVFHIGVISQNGLQMAPWQLPVRSFVGIFLIETFFSLNYFFPGVGFLLSFIVAICTKKHLALHDFIANTIVIDIENTPVFVSEQEREEVYPSQK